MPGWFSNPLVWIALVLMTLWSLQRIVLPSFDKHLRIDRDLPRHTWQEALAVIVVNVIAITIVLRGFVVASGHSHWNLQLLVTLDAVILGYMVLRCVSAVLCIGRVRRLSKGLDAISVACGMYATAIGLLPFILPGS